MEKLKSDDNLSNFLGEIVDVTIDRPLGSTHPKHKNIIYPVNYGFIPKTISGDGMEVDVYVIGVSKPIKKYRGFVIAVVVRKDDVENKIVVVDEDEKRDKYSKRDIERIVHFQEQYFKTTIIMNEDGKQS